jgi:ABC-type multidrug transport system fused ATPase/permease subunit
MREGPSSLQQLLRQIFGLLSAAQKRECAAVLLVSISAACLTLGGVAGIAPFFAVLADPAAIERSAALGWLQRELAIETSSGFLVFLGAAFVGLLVLANLANFMALLSIGRFSQEVGARLHALLFDEYLHRELTFHARSNSAVLATRVVYDINRTVGGIVYSALTLCAGAATIVLIAAAVIVADPLVSVIAVAVLAASYTAIHALVRRRLIRNGEVVTHHWKARAQLVAESFAAIKDVAVHRVQPQLTARVAAHSAAIAAAQASTPAIAAAPKYVLECVMSAGLVAVALWAYGRAGAGAWLTHLAFLAFAAYRLLPAIQQVFAAVARIQAERAGFEAIAGDLQRARQRSPREPAPALGASWRGRPRHGIRIVDVSYRYPAERTAAISDISLEIPRGTRAAFAGPNGAGKSTLAELVLGLITPDTGRIEIDGVALDDGNRAAWLDTVAYVPQRVALLDATLAENIAFGVAPVDIDLERVQAAANAARLDGIIDALPAGLATVVGEHGARLSGGQRQRVALARALYRRASLLVVDEGTNALDTLTEAEIVAVLDALRGTCTVVLIGHRASAIAGCDLTFELDGGRLVARRTSTATIGSQARDVARR